MEEQRTQTLKLHITKGPGEGQILEYQPGSRVRVGRVVRGNDLTIKDAGISSKHLTIDTRPNGLVNVEWVVTDLGSSNGTVINDSTKLPANEPRVLRDGDCIKIGEWSCLLVRIESSVVGGVGAAESRLRRNHKRRAQENVGQPGKRRVGARTGGFKGSEVDVESQEVEDCAIVKGKARVLKNEALCSEKLGEKQQKRVGARTGGFKGSEVDVESQEVEDCAIKGKARVLKNEALCSEKLGEKQQNVGGPAKEKLGVSRLSPRRTRRRKKEEDLISDAGIEKQSENCELELEEKKDQVKGRNAGSKRTRRGKQKMHSVSDGIEKLDPIEVEVRNDVLEENKGAFPSKEGNENEKLEALSDRNPSVEEVGMRRIKGETTETTQAERDSSGVDHIARQIKVEIDNDGFEVGASNWMRNEAPSGLENDKGEGGQLPDLAKMSLREWFDFMEVYLPKQIKDETEKLITDIRIKAQRVREYVAEQKRHKGKEAAS